MNIQIELCDQITIVVSYNRSLFVTGHHKKNYTSNDYMKPLKNLNFVAHLNTFCPLVL